MSMFMPSRDEMEEYDNTTTMDTLILPEKVVVFETAVGIFTKDVNNVADWVFTPNSNEEK